MKKDNLKILATSFTQVGLVSINTVLIVQGYVLGIFLASFTISLLWSYNVSRIALSDLRKKLIYSLGAGLGAVAGYHFIKLLL